MRSSTLFAIISAYSGFIVTSALPIDTEGQNNPYEKASPRTLAESETDSSQHLNLTELSTDKLSFGNVLLASDGDLDDHDKPESHECSDVVNFSDKCSFVKKHCNEEHLGFFNYLEIYYCSNSWSLASIVVVGICIWLAMLFMAIGIAASEFLCPNLNTISKMLGLSESLAGVTFLAFGNGSPDVFSTYAAMKIGSGSLAIGELIGAASFITAVVAGSMAIIRPFKVARRSFTRDIAFFTVAVGFSMYFVSDGVITRWECLAMLAIYISYVVFVVGWHWYNTTKRRRYLVETRARDFYTEAGYEANIEQDEEIRDVASILTQGLDYTGFNTSAIGEDDERRSTSTPRRFASPRGSIIALPTSPVPVWQEQFEDEQEEVYGELTRGMRLRPQNLPSSTSSQNAMSAVVSAATSGSELHVPGSHSPITPIRPSLFGALEFRNVLQQLEDSRSTHANSIPLKRRSHENGDNEDEQGLSQSLPNTESYLSLQASAEDDASSPVHPSGNTSLKKHLTLPTRLKSHNTSTSSLPTTSARNGATYASLKESPEENEPHAAARLALPKLQIPQLVVTEYHSVTNSPTSPTASGQSTSECATIDGDIFSQSTRKSTASIHSITSADILESSPPHRIPQDALDEVSSSSSVPHDIIPPSTHFSTTWFTYVLPTIPRKYVPYFSALFPSLVGLTSKSWISIVTSLATAPAIFCLNVTIPVIEAETIENEVSTPDAQSPKNISLSEHRYTSIERYRDEEDTTTETRQDPVDTGRFPSNEQMGLIVSQGAAPYVPINRWLLIVQALLGPLFVLTSSKDDEGSWPAIIIYSVVSSATFLIMIRIFLPDPKSAPTYVQFVSLIGFVIAISWISLVANEVVGILKALGIMFHISDAILGLTVFAVGNSLGDLVANVTVAKMGFPMMALSACFGGPMLNILVGVGMSGLLVMSGKSHGSSSGYHIHISHSLIISGVTLLITLLFLLITIPLNKWRMSRTIGIVTVSFWIVSTIINVIMEVTVFK